MASIWYWLEFTWNNEILQYSALSNPLELFGLILIVVLLALIGFVTILLFKRYRETEESSVLAWALATLFLTLAVIFLIFEKLGYSSMGNAAFGDFMAIIAIICVSIAIVSFANFSFQMTYPEHVKMFTIIVAILAFIYVSTLAITIASGLSDVSNYELVYPLEVNLIVYAVLSPIIAISPIVFFSFYFRNRETDRPHALRALLLGIGLLCFAVGYIAEVAPFFPTELSIPLRLLFLATALIFIICFTMPQWFKDMIGWTE